MAPGPLIAQPWALDRRGAAAGLRLQPRRRASLAMSARRGLVVATLAGPTERGGSRGGTSSLPSASPLVGSVRVRRGGPLPDLHAVRQVLGLPPTRPGRVRPDAADVARRGRDVGGRSRVTDAAPMWTGCGNRSHMARP